MTNKINDLPDFVRRKVRLCDLSMKPADFQPRERTLDAPHVAQLTRALKRGSTFDPLKVWRDEDGNLVILDGHHRFEALRAAGYRGKVEVYLFECSMAAARLVASADNCKERLPLSSAERTQWAWKLHCAHGHDYGKEALAQYTGISPSTVSTMRRYHKALVEQEISIPPLWEEVRKMMRTQSWRLTDAERAALFLEQRATLKDKIGGPVRAAAKLDANMTVEVVAEEMGAEVFEAALVALGYINPEHTPYDAGPDWQHSAAPF